LSELKNTTCDSVKITVLADNYGDIVFSASKDNTIIRKAQGLRCLSEHGLSLFIEVTNGEELTSILFDTGGIKKTVVNNIKELAINLDPTKFLIISHGHFDHVGGLLESIEQIPNVQMYCHPKLDTAYYGCRDGNVDLPEGEIDKKAFRKIKKQYTLMGPLKLMTPFTLIEEKLNAVGGKLITFEGMKNLLPGVYIYNNLDYLFDFERPKNMLMEDQKMYSHASFSEETYMAINVKGKGWLIIAGCAHSGILNSIETIKKQFNEPIYAVIGGFHLFKVGEERIKATIDYFKKINSKLIMPMHCTSRQFYDVIKQDLPNVVVNSAVGTELNF